MHLTFLGTGASGGTPGEGRSRRLESSLLVRTEQVQVLVDVTRDVEEQLPEAGDLTAALLTHGHRDASGGVSVLRELRGDRDPLPIHASERTHRAVRGRTSRLEHVELHDVEDGDRISIGDLEAVAVEVPHARRERFPTFAWRLQAGGRAFVYASDVAELTAELEEHAAGADLLVLDGAMYGRSIFTHLRIEEAVPTVCDWSVDRILLTQIGRTAPPHDELTEVVADLCDRARPAHDGMQLHL